MNLSDLIKLKEEYKSKLKAEGETAIREYIREFFENNPEIEAIRWVQYAPSFNDGDPCVFSMHEPDVKTQISESGAKFDLISDGKFSERSDDADDEGFRSLYNLKGNDKHIRDAVVQLYRDLSAVEEALEEIFGSHSKIVATRNSIEIDGYYDC